MLAYDAITNSHPTNVTRLGATHRGRRLTDHYQKGFILLSNHVYLPDLYL